MLDEVHLLAKLRRNNNLEKPLVAGPLPGIDDVGQVEPFAILVESAFLSFLSSCGAFSFQIASMGFPLSWSFILGICDSHRTTLYVRRGHVGAAARGSRQSLTCASPCSQHDLDSAKGACPHLNFSSWPTWAWRS